MGVDISGILERKPTSFDELRGRRIAIDAFNTLYQFLTIIRQPDGTPLMDSKGRVTSHLSGLFYRTANMLEKKIRPVFVFDGEPSALKKATIARRAEVKMEAEEARKKAIDEGRTQDAAMYAQRTARLTKEMVAEAKELLGLMGVPHVQAPSEGEAQCAAMNASGLADAVGSQDYDSLLFGAPTLVRNLTVAGKRKLPRRNIFVDVVPEEINLQENLRKLGISRQQLVWIGILSGTDFNKGIYGIGAKKALKLVKENASMEKIAETLGEKAGGMDWREVQALFENPPAKEVTIEELRPREAQREKLVAFMNGEHDFSMSRLESSLQKAFGEPLASDQSSLKKWF
ncbi:flap endonuclease-1 [Candidatus Micrarchaeota archaeon]|nr:flap endonuclease-1 [Candidatus Micrarchaeota archaeon]